MARQVKVFDCTREWAIAMAEAVSDHYGMPTLVDRGADEQDSIYISIMESADVHLLADGHVDVECGSVENQIENFVVNVETFCEGYSSAICQLKNEGRLM